MPKRYEYMNTAYTVSKLVQCQGTHTQYQNGGGGLLEVWSIGWNMRCVIGLPLGCCPWPEKTTSLPSLHSPSHS